MVSAAFLQGAGESMAAGLERDEVLEREARKLLDQRGGVVFETDSQVPLTLLPPRASSHNLSELRRSSETWAETRSSKDLCQA